MQSIKSIFLAKPGNTVLFTAEKYDSCQSLTGHYRKYVAEFTSRHEFLHDHNFCFTSETSEKRQQGNTADDEISHRHVWLIKERDQ